MTHPILILFCNSFSGFSNLLQLPDFLFLSCVAKVWVYFPISYIKFRVQLSQSFFDIFQSYVARYIKEN